MAYYITDEQLEECSLDEKLKLVTRILGTISDTKALSPADTYGVLTALNKYTTEIKATATKVQADFEEKVASAFEANDVVDFGNLRGSKVTSVSYDIDTENLTDEDIKNIVNFVITSKNGYKFNIPTKVLSESAKTELVNLLFKHGLVSKVIKPTYNAIKKYCEKNGLKMPEVETEEVSISWSFDQKDDDV